MPSMSLRASILGTSSPPIVRSNFEKFEANHGVFFRSDWQSQRSLLVPSEVSSGTDRRCTLIFSLKFKNQKFENTMFEIFRFVFEPPLSVRSVRSTLGTDVFADFPISFISLLLLILLFEFLLGLLARIVILFTFLNIPILSTFLLYGFIVVPYLTDPTKTG